MRIAIVTGASSGMGREFVKQVSKKEKFDEIWVIARRKEALESLKKEVKAKIRPITLDLQNPESFETYKKLLAEEKPEVALLANIAGYGKFGKYDEISLDDCLGMIDLNCKALVAMSQLTIPYMKRGSKILQLDSLSAFQPVPYLNVYGSSKSFVLSYSRALNRELKTKGIRVMSVNPGWVKTEFFDHATKSSNDAITYFNVMYDAKDVIKTAIRDLYHTKKDVSIHGFQIKAQVLLVKLLPHKIVMEIWMRQQKHK
jgi:short-subunit dehydrogenase